MTDYQIPNPPVTVADHRMIQDLRRQARDGDFAAKRALHQFDRERATRRAGVLEQRRKQQRREGHTVRATMQSRAEQREPRDPWDAA